MEPHNILSYPNLRTCETLTAVLTFIKNGYSHTAQNLRIPATKILAAKEKTIYTK